MSKYTTEVRYICENYAGLDESVGLSHIDEVLDEATPKVFDFSYPIFEEAYRRPLERKILSHYYTREIGYETVGRWKLALRNKMNEIMPYYNQLYKAAGQFGRLNLFDDVDVSESHVGSGTSDGNRSVTVEGNVTDKVTENTKANESGDDTRSRVTSDKENEKSTENRSVTGSDGGTVKTVTVGNDERSKTESVVKNDSEDRDITKTGSDNKTIGKTGSNTLTKTEQEHSQKTEENTGKRSNTGISESQRDVVGEENGTNTNTKTEELNSQNDTSNVASNTADSVKRRLYSDTPQGAIDFSNDGSELGSGVGVGGTGADSLYVTNLTKDIGADRSNGSSVGSSTGKSDSKVEESSVVENSVRNNERAAFSNLVKDNSEYSGNEQSDKSVNVNDSVSISENVTDDTDYQETIKEGVKNNGSSVGSFEEKGKNDRDETVTKEGNKSETVEGSGSRNNERNGSEVNSGEYRKEVGKDSSSERIGKNDSKETESNGVKTTESFVNTIKGKRGNMTYAAMFIELQKALVNIDAMVIEELGTLFMGLWE